MASTASPLRTVPSRTATGGAAPVPLPAPAAYARAARAARANHPAGRALRHPSVDGSVQGLAPVVPLRPIGADAVVVPFRRGAERVATAPGDATPGDAPPGDATPGRPARLRLTRRGRLVLGGLGVVAALGIAAVAGPVLGGEPDPALELAGRSSVVVHSGDTLWSIAQSVAPDADPRGVVDALREANGLQGTGLVPGQVLVLP